MSIVNLLMSGLFLMLEAVDKKTCNKIKRLAKETGKSHG